MHNHCSPQVFGFMADVTKTEMTFQSGDPAMSTTEELVINSAKLFSLPDVYIRLKAVLEDPNSSMNDMAEVIKHDPGLTARLLRMVNSAFFGLGSNIETVSQATRMLGTQQIHDLALATSVTEAFSDVSTDVMDMNVFWRNSVACGLASRLLASQCNVLDNERLFIAGLLHAIGHLVMYQLLPMQMQQALMRSKEQARPLFQVERDLLGFDYAKVGGKLMNEWGLPDSLQESTTRHPEPAYALTYGLETAIVHIATHVATAIETGTLKTQCIDPSVWQITGITPEALDSSVRETAQELDSAMSLLFNKMRKAS